MNCPLCLDTALTPTFHADVELDICPKCRGVWLDRGELERIARGPDVLASPAPPAPTSDDRDRGDDTPRERPAKGKKSKKKKSKKKQFADRLGDVFEEVLDL